MADTLEFGMQAQVRASTMRSVVSTVTAEYARHIQVVQLNPNSEWDTGVKAVRRTAHVDMIRCPPRF